MGNLAVKQKALGFFTAIIWLAVQWFVPDFAAAAQPLDRIQFAPWELVTALAWSPVGQIMAVSAGTTIRLYDVISGANFYSNDLGVYSHSLVFSPKGDWLAAGSRDGRIRLWLVKPVEGGFQVSPDPERIIEAHRKGVNALDF